MVTTSIRPTHYHYHPAEALQRPITGPVWTLMVKHDGRIVSWHEGPMAECLHLQVALIHRLGWCGAPHHLPRRELAVRPGWSRLPSKTPQEIERARRSREAELGRVFGIVEGMHYDDNLLRRPASMGAR
jgi:hypothetical protein